MMKATIIVSVIIELLWVVRAFVYLEGAISRAATWRELPRCWPQGLWQPSLRSLHP